MAFPLNSTSITLRKCLERTKLSIRYFDTSAFQDAKKTPPPQPKSSKSSKPSYRFVDRTRVRVTGGMGGKGSLSMKPSRKRYKLKPDGGHGGNGGSVILVADPHEQSLRWSHPHLQAEKGSNGDSQDCHGKNGENLIVRVPCGVLVKRVLNHGEVWDEEREMVLNSRTDDSSLHDNEDKVEVSREVQALLDAMGHTDDNDLEDADDEEEDWVSDDDDIQKERDRVILADLDKPGAHVMVARGGRGGLGSSIYGGESGPMPDPREMIAKSKPQPGEIAFLELELKLIADIGLVGFPNAGKSSLLRAMSRATPEVAPYPFTTLHPILGSVDYRDGVRIRVADIPGLIDGASEGRGKGFDFLRHIERTKALLYIVDAAGVDFRDPAEDLRVLANEIASYGNGAMMDRRALIVANKIDLLSEESLPELKYAISQAAKEMGILTDHEIFAISAGVTGTGLSSLSKAMREVVATVDEENDLWYDDHIG
ncbi:GTPase [Fistulifera solaris]|uniref:GTPase n=1 Tax=Fistulifera solaris TaxID=1519565 RepID=A0A1Z5K6W4_FISSO|nr:GTPase [Fistulifera solaris]|eukprot:GAX22023.1 GTPase [Fistulifera solaris]